MMITKILPIRWKVVLLLIFLLTLACFSHPLPSNGAISKTLHIVWSYDTSLPGLAGYRVYQDGVQVLEISNPAAFAADVTVLLADPISSVITMTAFDVDGNESAPSLPYPLSQVVDSDYDGISDNFDNCPLDVNPKQLDTDRDGLGDECDSDMDGDGLTNSEEYDLGSDPLQADTDGDGVIDGFDGYPINPKLDLCMDLIRNDSTREVFVSLQDAIEDPYAANYDSILITAADYQEDILYNRNLIFTLSGGYFCNFSYNPAVSYINSLVIREGTLIIDNLVIGSSR